MSSQNDIPGNAPTIGNGAAIIERFGGIRPMASKINVPVTTVQGWKKRDAIPAGRLEQIQRAAREHNLDISDILSATPVANENAKVEETKVEEIQVLRRKPAAFDLPGAPPRPVTSPLPNVVYEDLAQKLSQTERKAVTKSAMINVVLLLITGGAIGLLLWPQSPISQDGRHMAALDEKLAQLRVDVAGVKKDQGAIDTMIPADVQKQISDLQQQVEKVGEVTANAAGPAAQEMEQRIAKLEQNVGTMTGSPALAGIVERFQAMQASAESEQQFTDAWSALSGFVSGYQGSPQDMISGLQSAAAQNPGLAAAFQNVPPENMKAAAMLFGMVQVRSLLGRDGVPIQGDLQILKSLVGSDDAELTAALDTMAPLAGDHEIMTVTGVTNQFQDVAVQVVQASLTGQNVSISDLAKARLGQVMKVEKDGQLISGTPEQAAVEQARALLQQGDLTGAIGALQGLNGPAAAAAEPWIHNANATLAAQQLKDTLTRAINLKAYGSGALPGIDRAGFYGPVKTVP